MWIDWSNPPKSIEDFSSGRYHQEWRPLGVERLANFDRPGWKQWKHSTEKGHFYGYKSKAEVHLDTSSNINTRRWSLRGRHLLIRLIEVFPKHRQQGVMVEILEDLIDQLPSIDLVASLFPQDCDRQHREMMVGKLKSTYERLGFMEIQWQYWLPIFEHQQFEERSEKRGFRPTLMARPATNADENIRQIYRDMAV